MNLYDSLKRNFILPDAYEDWHNYRNTLTSYLIRQADEITLPLTDCSIFSSVFSKPTLAIVGAGACNDLDLSALTAHFSQITLIDYDIPATKQALCTYHLETHPQIVQKEESLTGITENDYRKFCSMLQFFLQESQQLPSPTEFEAYAISLIRQFYTNREHHAWHPAPDTFDYIWCFGVHSQLQSMFSYIYHAFCLNLAHQNTDWISPNADVFHATLKEYNTQHIPKINDHLIAAARHTAIFGNENSPQIEGAALCISDLRKRRELQKEGLVLWPFCPKQQISYEMLIQHLVKN